MGETQPVDEETVEPAPDEDDAIDLSRHAAGVPPEESMCDYFDEHPKVAEAFRAAGYKGACWFKLRAPTASERRESEFVMLYGREGSDKIRLSNDEIFRHNVKCMILSARFPEATSRGGWREYVFEHNVGDENKRMDAISGLGAELDAWLQEQLAEMRGGTKSVGGTVEQVKNSSGAAES